MLDNSRQLNISALMKDISDNFHVKHETKNTVTNDTRSNRVYGKIYKCLHNYDKIINAKMIVTLSPLIRHF